MSFCIFWGFGLTIWLLLFQNVHVWRVFCTHTFFCCSLFEFLLLTAGKWMTWGAADGLRCLVKALLNSSQILILKQVCFSKCHWCKLRCFTFVLRLLPVILFGLWMLWCQCVIDSGCKRRGSVSHALYHALFTFSELTATWKSVVHPKAAVGW